MPDLYISKITLPSGGTYLIKDKEARDLIDSLSGGALYFGGVTTTELTDGGTTYPITINGESYNQKNGCVVVYNVQGGVSREFVWTESTPGDYTTGKWVEFGDLSTLGQLAYQNVVSLNKGSGKDVLGANAQFSASTSNVTFEDPDTKNVLGADARFQAGMPTFQATTSSLQAFASDTNVTKSSVATAITGLGTPSTDTFVKSVQVTTGKKLVTTSIQQTNGDIGVIQYISTLSKKLQQTTIYGVSETEKDVLQNITNQTKQLGTKKIQQVTGNTNVTVQNVSSVGTADTWNFQMGSGTDAETLIISGANGTTPTLGEAQTASKITNAEVSVASGSLVESGGGDSVSTGFTKSYTNVAVLDPNNVTVATGQLTEESGANGDVVVCELNSGSTNVAKMGSNVTVATGSTNASGQGDAIVSDVTVGDSASAITGITPQTKVFLQDVTVSNPTIKLSYGNGGTGSVDVATGVMQGITIIQDVSVIDKDLSTVLQSVGTGTAAAPTITISAQDATKVALYNDISVTVS